MHVFLHKVDVSYSLCDWLQINVDPSSTQMLTVSNLLIVLRRSTDHIDRIHEHEHGFCVKLLAGSSQSCADAVEAFFPVQSASKLIDFDMSTTATNNRCGFDEVLLEQAHRQCPISEIHSSQSQRAGNEVESSRHSSVHAIVRSA
jgi:hypothetical protein